MKSKTPWSVSMEKPTGLSLRRITMQCYMDTLWGMDLCSKTLGMECMLMIASIVQLFIDALSQNNVENISAFADVTQLTMAEFEKTCTSPTTQLWLMYMDMLMILRRCIHAERARL